MKAFKASLRLVIVMVITFGGTAGLAGCEQALFPEALPRTQYERYDKMRGVYRPKETTDPRGVPVADLRSRLSVYQ